MKIADALAAAPPPPACFPDKLQWAAYLLQCQVFANKKVQRPFEAGAYKPSFNFCKDCMKEHQRSMSAAGKCDSEQFRRAAVIPIAVVEPACN